MGRCFGGFKSSLVESLEALRRIFACEGDNRWRGMGELDDSTGRMHTFAFNLVKSVRELSGRKCQKKVIA